MVETGNLDINTLVETRGRKMKYPFCLLKEKGDYFIWDEKKDISRIRTSAVYHKLKITCKTINNKLHIIKVA